MFLSHDISGMKFKGSLFQGTAGAPKGEGLPTPQHCAAAGCRLPALARIINYDNGDENDNQTMIMVTDSIT